jgi:hypothetical protein
MTSGSKSEEKSAAVDDVRKFLEKKYLHWLEALSGMRKISEGVRVIEKLDKALVRYLVECKDANRLVSRPNGESISLHCKSTCQLLYLVL